MTDFLQNVYVYLWAALAVLMLAVTIKYRSSRQGLLGLVMTVFFVFMTVWYGLRTFGGIAMFDGTLGIVFRCVLLGFLAVLVLIYFFFIKKNKR